MTAVSGTQAVSVLPNLVAWETSGIARRAFAALGHDLWPCDLAPCSPTVVRSCAEGECSMTTLSFSMDLLGWNAAASVWLYHPRCNLRSLYKYAFFPAERAYRISRNVHWFESIVSHEARSKGSLVHYVAVRLGPILQKVDCVNNRRNLAYQVLPILQIDRLGEGLVMHLFLSIYEQYQKVRCRNLATPSDLRSLLGNFKSTHRFVESIMPCVGSRSCCERQRASFLAVTIAAGRAGIVERLP